MVVLDTDLLIQSFANSLSKTQKMFALAQTIPQIHHLKLVHLCLEDRFP